MKHQIFTMVFPPKVMESNECELEKMLAKYVFIFSLIAVTTTFDHFVSYHFLNIGIFTIDSCIGNGNYTSSL